MNVIAHNMTAANAQRMYNITGTQKQKSTEKLSSGYRINRSADDAAGLAISEKMRWNIKGLDRASMNIKDGISYVQVAEGALGEIHSMLDRMKELCVQGANDTNTDQDRQQIQLELDQLKEESGRVFDSTDFNTMPVFNRKLSYTEYADAARTQAIGTGSKYIRNDDNNYGLVAVMNADGKYNNITTAKNLAETVSFSGNGSDWVSSGREPNVITGGNSTYFHYDQNGNIINSSWNSQTLSSFTNNAAKEIFETNFSNINLTNGSTWTSPQGNVYTYNNGQLSRTVTGSDFDSNGSRVATTQNEVYSLYNDPEGTTYTGSLTITATDASGNILRNERTTVSGNSGSGGGFRAGGKYASVSLDFSNLGTDFHIKDLKDLGFSSQCCHGCGTRYSVKFVEDPSKTKTTSNGVKYSTASGHNEVLEIDISDITDDKAGGEKLVAAIVDAANKSSSFTNHYEQYAYNKNTPGKLYLYENAGSVSDGKNSTWEPVTYPPNPDPPEPDPLPDYLAGNRMYREDPFLHIQSSSLAFQAIMIERPVMTNESLGITNINVRNHESASHSIDAVDGAIDYVSYHRSKLGAVQNRLEHAYDIDNNTSENTQAAESRIRDTDISSEMVRYSMQSILEQAGQSVMAQANQSLQRILTLLQ